ncbi:MAG: aminopeptidase P family N-terminal domain-containing protein, partial [Pseudorhodobacter sp.]|nr:aminopeptidase P family N-terminal domain-containing protein [Pseudorhodobacter sp.]
MFQTFEQVASPLTGAARLVLLRGALADNGLAGFIVPRADAHQGEYVTPRDERLQWLCGFTGSAGFCVVLPDVAGVFIDG